MARKRKPMSKGNLRALKARHERGFFDPIKQSKRRREQLRREERMATRLRHDGYEVYSPTVVCDRVAIRDGQVFFVEFKKAGQKLRAGQQRVRDLVPARYLTIYQ